jgi:hypothetical protein
VVALEIVKKALNEQLRDLRRDVAESARRGLCAFSGLSEDAEGACDFDSEQRYEVSLVDHASNRSEYVVGVWRAHAPRASRSDHAEALLEYLVAHCNMTEGQAREAAEHIAQSASERALKRHAPAPLFDVRQRADTQGGRRVLEKPLVERDVRRKLVKAALEELAASSAKNVD